MSPEPPAVDYDVASVNFDPVSVQAAANVLKTQSGNVLGSLVSIANTLDGLALGWAGESAAEAQAFGARWVAVGVQLFGTEAAVNDEDLDSADGVLNVLTSGLAAIVEGFSESEAHLKKMLDDFKTGLGTTQTMDYTTPTTVDADTRTAVNESWP